MTGQPLRSLAAAALAALAFAHGAARADDMAQAVDRLVRQGDDAPGAAIDALGRLADANATPARRTLQLAIGLVAARNGMEAEARERIAALHALRDTLADADAHLVGAELEKNAGHAEGAYEHARAALHAYDLACEPGARQRTDCDYRARWRALDFALDGADGQGNLVDAAAYVQKMLDVARQAGDRPREALAIAESALIAEENGDPTSANRLLAQAQRIARVESAPWLQARVMTIAATLHRGREQLKETERDCLEILSVAKAAGLVRTEVLTRANLSDLYISERRPADALTQVQLALPQARGQRDLRTERQLMHNATLARIALGSVAQAKTEIAREIDQWEKDTGPGERAQALHEFSTALEAAGDTAGAIDLFHKQEALERQIRSANKKAAEADMHARYDGESQQRRIELLARDNQLKAAELGNQALARRLWMIAGAAFVLLGGLALLAYRRVREVNRALVRHEAQLRVFSERDALTGLANRRQFREVMRARGGERGFEGALLMVDVDHFKRINDGHGHAAGDRVLVEVARRLGAAVRSGDLVARWGGEEFLVFAPGVEGAGLEALAERLRTAVNEAPIPLEGGQSLATTVSIGYASFPLPDSPVEVDWEQAVNLADVSLYAAKDHGRDCAVGIARSTATSADALREVEADLARAHAQGRVTLKVTPAARERAPVAAA